MPFNGMSPSGDAEAEMVYVNYGTPEDIKKFDKLKISVRDKIVLARYGQNFRGVKAFLAQEHGAGGLNHLFGSRRRRLGIGRQISARSVAARYGVQRGSMGYMFEFPGDPTTPGIASVPSCQIRSEFLQQNRRRCQESRPLRFLIPMRGQCSSISADPDTPREWQGALPFTYHIGPGPAKVKMHLNRIISSERSGTCRTR